MRTTLSSKAKKTCETCGSSNIKTHMATFPVKLGPKQLNVGKVSVRECMDCYSMTPKAGQEKIARCTMSFMMLLDQ